MKLIDVTKAFTSDEQCLAYFENRRWPDGVRCVTCGSDDFSRITRKSKSKNKRAQLLPMPLSPHANSSSRQLRARSCTDSHLPLNKWFMAIALLVDAKKSMTALQLSRHLDCNYRTAWYLAASPDQGGDED